MINLIQNLEADALHTARSFSEQLGDLCGRLMCTVQAETPSQAVLEKYKEYCHSFDEFLNRLNALQVQEQLTQLPLIPEEPAKPDELASVSDQFFLRFQQARADGGGNTRAMQLADSQREYYELCIQAVQELEITIQAFKREQGLSEMELSLILSEEIGSIAGQGKPLQTSAPPRTSPNLHRLCDDFFQGERQVTLAQVLLAKSQLVSKELSSRLLSLVRDRFRTEFQRIGVLHQQGAVTSENFESLLQRALEVEASAPKSTSAPQSKAALSALDQFLRAASREYSPEALRECLALLKKKEVQLANTGNPAILEKYKEAIRGLEALGTPNTIEELRRGAQTTNASIQSGLQTLLKEKTRLQGLLRDALERQKFLSRIVVQTPPEQPDVVAELAVAELQTAQIQARRFRVLRPLLAERIASPLQTLLQIQQAYARSAEEARAAFQSILDTIQHDKSQESVALEKEFAQHVIVEAEKAAHRGLQAAVRKYNAVSIEANGMVLEDLRSRKLRQAHLQEKMETLSADTRPLIVTQKCIRSPLLNAYASLLEENRVLASHQNQLSSLIQELQTALQAQDDLLLQTHAAFKERSRVIQENLWDLKSVQLGQLYRKLLQARRQGDSSLEKEIIDQISQTQHSNLKPSHVDTGESVEKLLKEQLELNDLLRARPDPLRQTNRSQHADDVSETEMSRRLDLEGLALHAHRVLQGAAVECVLTLTLPQGKEPYLRIDQQGKQPQMLRLSLISHANEKIVDMLGLQKTILVLVLKNRPAPAEFILEDEEAHRELLSYLRAHV